MSARKRTQPVGCSKCDQPHPRCAGHVERCQSCRNTGGNAIGKPCASCGSHDVLLQPCGRWPTRGSHVCTSHGSAPKKARAKAAREVERQEAEADTRRAVQRLGLEAPEEPVETTAMRLLRRAVNGVAVFQALVDQLVDAAGGDLIASLSVRTGNTSKPNEVEDHWAYRELKYWESEAFSRAANVRKLGIEQAAIDHMREQVTALGGEIAAVIREVADRFRAALIERGGDREVIEATYREQLGPIVRAVIEARSSS